MKVKQIQSITLLSEIPFYGNWKEWLIKVFNIPREPVKKVRVAAVVTANRTPDKGDRYRDQDGSIWELMFSNKLGSNTVFLIQIDCIHNASTEGKHTPINLSLILEE